MSSSVIHPPRARAVAAICCSAALMALAPALLGEADVLASPWLAAVNLLPWLGPWLLLLAATRRPWTSAAWLALFQSALLGIHALKLRHLGLPLVPADANAAPQLLQTPSLYLRYLEAAWLWGAAATVVAVALLHRLEPPSTLLRAWRLRAALGLGGIALLASLLAASAPWRWLYERQRLDLNVWLPAEAARDRGAAAHFLHLYLHTASGLPKVDPAVVAAARAWLVAEQARVGPSSTPGTTPDLIVVQSESFMDPGRLRGIDSADFAPNLARLRRKHAHGDLQVPAYGGLTTRTEFEFLTGFPLAQEPNVQYPYQGLVHRPMPALPWTLRHAGYRTAAVHPYERSFYRRDRVFPLLGFDHFHSIGEFDPKDRHGYHIADAALNRRIVELMDSDAPRFVFAVSVENHGPWNRGRAIPADQLPPLPEGPPLPEADALALRQFLHHTRNADAALGELADWVLQRERPTLLLFYGDHLPGLDGVFARWPFDDGRYPVFQPTPWLLIDNRGGAAERTDLSAADLAGWLLARAGIGDDGVFAQVETLRRAREADALPAGADDWHRQLVAAQLREAPSARHAATLDAEFVALEDWSPRSAEQGSDASPPSLWFRFATPPQRGYYLSIGDERLRILDRHDRVVIANLPELAYERLVQAPGRWPVHVNDPAGSRRQQVGEFVVRPQAARLGGWLGLGAGPFCAVVGFGPDRLQRPSSPDATTRDGLWVRAECVPKDARLTLNGQALVTTVVDDLATAPVPGHVLGSSDQARIALSVGDQALEVGAIPVVP